MRSLLEEEGGVPLEGGADEYMREVLRTARAGGEREGGGAVIPVDPLQGPAVVLGMAGAALVASRSQGIRRAGFGAWVVGNLLWVIYATVDGNAYMMTLFGFYWITAALGLMNTREGEDAGRSTPQD